MRFVFLDSRFTLHASFPHSVALMQLRFTSLAVVSSREDFHLQECAHAGRTKKSPAERGLDPKLEAVYSFCVCMKLSKRASVKRNHRFWSLRNAE